MNLSAKRWHDSRGSGCQHAGVCSPSQGRRLDPGRPGASENREGLPDTVFQSEIIVNDADFQKAFPEEQGFRVFLIDARKALTRRSKPR